MNADEAAAACRVAADVVIEVTSTVEEVHRGVLGRVRGASGGRYSAVPAVVAGVDHVTVQVYRAVRGSAAVSGAVGAVVARAAVDGEAPSAAQSKRGAARLAGLAAAVGDRLESDARVAALAPRMTFRSDGKQLPIEDLQPGRAGLVVFVHGLAGTEHQWGSEYVRAVEDRGFGAAFVRYNTGRAISANGAEFADLMEQAHARAVSAGRGRLILVGHSMGGLVISSALHRRPAQHWQRAVTQLVTLGTPHRGAPLEQAAASSLGVLRRFRESAPIAMLGDQRSAGIKDLRTGLTHVPPGKSDGSAAALPDHLEHHAVVAVLGRPGSVRGALLGDGMVRPASAAGPGTGGRVTVHRLYDTGHMRLLNHPVVADLLSALASSARADTSRR